MTCPKCKSRRNYRDGSPRDESGRSLDQPVFYCFDCKHCWDDNGLWVTEDWGAKLAAIEAECEGQAAVPRHWWTGQATGSAAF